jgi:ABC-type glycerol-3-phosphate transport system substrate-binding protein
MRKFMAGRFLLFAAAAVLSACAPEAAESSESETLTTLEHPSESVISEWIASDGGLTIAGDIYQKTEDRPGTILLIVGGSSVGPRTDVAPFAPIIIDDDGDTLC